MTDKKSLSDIQNPIIEAITVVAENIIRKTDIPQNTFGIVAEEPMGFEAVVKIRDELMEVSLPEHLHTWIQKGDVVIINDLYGDGRKKVITGKTGSTSTSPSLVFYDKDKERNISGVDGLFQDGEKLNASGTVQKDGGE